MVTPARIHVIAQAFYDPRGGDAQKTAKLPPDLVDKFAADAPGRPMFLEHAPQCPSLPPAARCPIGHVERMWCEKGAIHAAALVHGANQASAAALARMRDRTRPRLGVSIGTNQTIVPDENHPGEYRRVGCGFVELSLVERPAVPGSHVLAVVDTPDAPPPHPSLLGPCTISSTGHVVYATASATDAADAWPGWAAFPDLEEITIVSDVMYITAAAEPGQTVEDPPNDAQHPLADVEMAQTSTDTPMADPDAAAAPPPAVPPAAPTTPPAATPPAAPTQPPAVPAGPPSAAVPDVRAATVADVRVLIETAARDLATAQTADGLKAAIERSEQLAKDVAEARQNNTQLQGAVKELQDASRMATERLQGVLLGLGARGMDSKAAQELAAAQAALAAERATNEKLARQVFATEADKQFGDVIARIVQGRDIAVQAGESLSAELTATIDAVVAARDRGYADLYGKAGDAPEVTNFRNIVALLLGHSQLSATAHAPGKRVGVAAGAAAPPGTTGVPLERMQKSLTHGVDYTPDEAPPARRTKPTHVPVVGVDNIASMILVSRVAEQLAQPRTGFTYASADTAMTPDDSIEALVRDGVLKRFENAPPPTLADMVKSFILEAPSTLVTYEGVGAMQSAPGARFITAGADTNQDDVIRRMQALFGAGTQIQNAFDV